MPMAQQQPQQNSIEQFKNAASWLIFICQSLAVTAEVTLLRRRFGERYLGMQAGAGILIILLFSLCWPGYDLRPLMLYLIAYLVMCFRSRLNIIRRRLRGEFMHSYYSGLSRLTRLFPKASEVTVKRFIEPAALLGVSVMVMEFNQPLGTYLRLGGIGLFLSVNMIAVYDRARAMDLNDAVIDQEQVAEQFRNMRRPRR